MDTCLPAGREREFLMFMYFVYAIESEIDFRIYVGLSKNPDVRIKEHNAGKTKSTKGYRPWKLVYKQECQSRKEARELEKYYKTGSGKEKLKDIIRLHSSMDRTRVS